METTRYIALLRGINVGGNNIIRMTDLKASFEELEFRDVVTYIQSGNVLFTTTEQDKQVLIDRIEQHLSGRFAYQSKIVLISMEHLRRIVESAPADFGDHPDEYRYNVLFLKEPLTTREALQSIRIKEEVDQVWEGEEVLYFSLLISRATQSYLSKIVGQPIYKSITIRNWNTTTKLLKK
ncbi:MAG: DUF1697 domain-containing protein [Proteiniphilum sp.]|nr:DUF1697 domain-containing protein [Proteiniphilum sp.]